MLQHLILLILLILVSGLVFLVIRWPQTTHHSFSQHAAAQPATIYYYVGLFTIVLPLTLLFFLGWFAPHFSLPLWFSCAIIVSTAAQYSVVWIPEVGGWKTKYHRHITGLSGVLLFLALAAIIFAEQASHTVKVATIIAMAIMLGSIGTSLKHKNQKHMLILQSIYYGAFFCAILSATYLG